MEDGIRRSLSNRAITPKPPNNPIKQTVHPVTHLAVARCAPIWPAAYRVRYTDTGKDRDGERPRLKHPNGLSSPSLSTWVGRGWPRSRAALHNLGFVQQAARAGAFRARKLAGSPARSVSVLLHPTPEPSRVEALRWGSVLSGVAASDPLAGRWETQRREQS